MTAAPWLVDHGTLLVALPAAYALDLLIGDPRGWPHPVRAIGWLVRQLEARLRRLIPWQRGAGILLVLIVLAVVAACMIAIRGLVVTQPTWMRIGVDVLLIQWGLSTRSLAGETLRVVRAAERGAWSEASGELAMIVGRDTADLFPEQMHRACMETVAENTTDAVISPLIITAFAGPLGLWLFKAVSTMDSMIGHRDERYRYFGWAAARLDDVLNFLPARITFLTMPIAAGLAGANGLAAWRLGWRDGRKHASPNAGIAEATMAGALGVELGGPASYEGHVIDRPWIGEPIYLPSTQLVRRAVLLMLITSFLAFLLGEGMVAFLVAWNSESALLPNAFVGVSLS